MFKQTEPRLFLAETPYVSINGEGQHIGYPVVFVRLQGCNVGCVWCDAMMTWPDKKGVEKAGIKYTFEELTQLLDSDEYIRVPRIWFTGGEPTLFSAEIANFIRFFKRNTVGPKRIFHLITSGQVFYKPLLYTVDQITIDIKPPSSKAHTSEDFIGWCVEDEQIRKKVEFKMVVAKTIEDQNFALQQIAFFKHMPFTIQPLYWSESEARQNVEVLNRSVSKEGESPDPKLKEQVLKDFAQPVGWNSIEEFCLQFMNILNNPNVRILPQLHKMMFPGRLSGI